MRIITLIAVSVVLTGCALFEATRLSDEQIARVIELAREKAVGTLNLNEGEQQTIRRTEPRFGYYLLADTYAQYFFHWPLPAGTIASVTGTGDILTLEGATVKRASTATE